MSKPTASAGGAPAAPAPVVFRIPAIALLAVTLLAWAATPVATSAPGLLVLYLVPLGIGVWVVRTRTTADATGLVVRGMLTRRVIPWSQVSSLRVVNQSEIRAVLHGGEEAKLPTVRPRDLPSLAAASGGHLPDPTVRADSAAPDASADTDAPASKADTDAPASSAESNPQHPRNAAE